MTKLSDTQLVILTTACQRDDRMVLPLPDRLKGGAAAKVLNSLLAKGLIDEVQAHLSAPVWRKTEDGHGLTLLATDAAFEALGIEPDEPHTGGTAAEDESAAPEPETGAEAASQAPEAAPAAKTRRSRADSKQAQMIAMLQRPDGATVAEMAEALEWQQHTVRGALAGTLKKKLGLEITSDKVESRGRVYRVAG